MSIRLRFTLLYNAILAATLIVFGASLMYIQARTTWDTLKTELIRSSDTVGAGVLRMVLNPDRLNTQPPPQAPPVPFETFSADLAFKKLPEREIVRVLSPKGSLVASPFGAQEEALPLSQSGLQALNNDQTWWQADTWQGKHMLIYSRPIVADGVVVYILQVARPLSERDSSLKTLATTLVIASVVILLVAFGIGWVLSGITLQPIQRITQTARAIGAEHDFSRRVAYTGPPDEVGQLATTFNAMLARLQEAYQRLAHSLEMQRNFVADVSHELRTPLTTLRGNLGLLGRNPPIPQSEQIDIVNDMVDESDRLIRLVNELLVLARADAGRSFDKEPLDIVPLLAETCHQARQLAPQRTITLHAASDLVIIADRDAFKQVLLIALDNALKHSAGDVNVSAAALETRVEIKVQDGGEGIPPDKLEHVFDRFYRGEDAAAIPGFGLGLPIAKALVEAQSGTIAIQSGPEKGTVLIFTFPRPPASA